MKIVLINTSENKGGAAVACKRLYNNLRQHGIDCKLIVFNKVSTDDNVIQIPLSTLNYFLLKILFFIELLIQRFLKRKHVDFSFTLFGLNLSEIKEVKEADVIHLHWINNSFVKINDIQKLIDSEKKIVWTLHDMWLFTGGCHYANECELYKDTCTKCPQLNRSIIDTAKNQQLKKARLNLERIKIITPSVWLKEIAAKSYLLRNSEIEAVPNCVDTNFFRRIDKLEALTNLNLRIDANEKILLFVAMNANDPRKGYFELIESLKHWILTSTETINLIIIGRLAELPDLDQSKIKIHTLGRIFDINLIVSAYSCADAFLMPSKQDNLPNTIMESLSCGTPIVAFSIGGIPEMVSHKNTGYLVQQGDTIGFATGIQWVLNNTSHLHNSCLQFAKENYSYDIIFSKHLEFYKK